MPVCVAMIFKGYALSTGYNMLKSEKICCSVYEETDSIPFRKRERDIFQCIVPCHLIFVLINHFKKRINVKGKISAFNILRHFKNIDILVKQNNCSCIGGIHASVEH